MVAPTCFGITLSKHVGATIHNILNELIGVFVGFSGICLLGILIFKGLTARRLYKLFGVKGLKKDQLCFTFDQVTRLGV
jgi:hypothetical protein